MCVCLSRHSIVISAAISVLYALPLVAVEVPFSTAIDVIETFDGAASIKAADMNGDGDLDLVGAALWDGEVGWWSNLTGDGSLWFWRALTSSFTEAIFVDVADINGDGTPDVVAVKRNSTGADVVWWSNDDGIGHTWTEHAVEDSFDMARWVTTADLDSDGDQDIIVTHFSSMPGSGYVGWLENETGDGASWQARYVERTLDGAHSVMPADIDGDGDLDLVAAGFADDAVVWFVNDGSIHDAAEWTRVDVDTSFGEAIAVHPADLDGDGDVDILGAAYGDDDVVWWINGGDGSTWTRRDIDTDFNGAYSVEAADVDADGDLDVVAAARLHDDVTWWENTAGDATAWTERAIDGSFDGARSVAVADIDGDGDLDVAAAAEFADDIAWWENETIHRNALFYSSSGIEATFAGADSVDAADVDGDGDLDVVASAWGENTIAWFENGNSWVDHVVTSAFTGVEDVDVGDINGDGRLDVLGAASGADSIGWWRNVNGSGTSWVGNIISGFDGAHAVHAADMDSDGDLDIVGAAFEDDTIAWWENLAGTGTALDRHDVETLLNGAYDVTSGDIDGDGDLDLVGAGFLGDEIRMWKNMNGAATSWNTYPVASDFDGASSVAACDIDGDGDLDIAGTAWADEQVSWWENEDGDGSSWSPHHVRFDFASAHGVCCGDIDADGDLDLIVASMGAPAATWFENYNGVGTHWSMHVGPFDMTGTRAVHGADLQGDGQLDIVYAAGSPEDEVAQHRNYGGQAGFGGDDVAPAYLRSGESAAIVRVDLTHNGRIGDPAIELRRLRLRFYDEVWAILTSEEANAILASLGVYRDNDNSGTWSATDELVAGVITFYLDLGYFNVSMTDGDPDCAVAATSTGSFFVVATATADGHLQTPNRFRIKAQGPGTLAEDADHDILVTFDIEDDVYSGLVEVTDMLFGDGFESGDTTSWSVSIP